jgi:hypothetical protein
VCTAGPALLAASCWRSAAANASSPGPSSQTTRPGLVQNCPIASVADAASCVAICGPRVAEACGSTTTGFIEPISANTGIGFGRAAARSHRARPPTSEPVKPTAVIAGCCTSRAPVAGNRPCSSENVPAGSPSFATQSAIIAPTSSLVPGCAGWPFTTTGQPAASADAVSPPATE